MTDGHVCGTVTSQMVEQPKRDLLWSTVMYVCGCCGSHYLTICALHEHLTKHEAGGSYHYDHLLRTAFPKFDTQCSSTQTVHGKERKKIVKQLKRFQGNIGKSEESKHMSDGIVIDQNSDRLEDNDNGFIEHIYNDNVLKLDYERTRKNIFGDKFRLKECTVLIDKIPCVADKTFATVKDEKVTTESVIDKADLIKSDATETIINTVGSADTSYVCVTEETSHSSDNLDAKLFGFGGLPELDSAFETKNHESNIGYLDELNETEVCNVTEDLKEKDANEKSHIVKFTKRKYTKKRPAFWDSDDVDWEEMEMNISKINKTKKRTELRQQRIVDKKCMDLCNNKLMEAGKVDGIKKRYPSQDKKYPIKKIVCYICGAEVSQFPYAYKEHIARHLNDAVLPCPKCDKKFSTHTQLLRHERLHESYKSFQCELCATQFSTEGNLKSHMATHTAEFPFKCNECPKSFRRKWHLKKHTQVVHCGIKAFTCSLCGKTWGSKSNLHSHMLIHNPGSFSCSYCGRKFNSPIATKRHEKIHTGEKPHRCHVCGHGFIQKTPYWSHMEKHHGLDKDQVLKMK